MLTFKDYRIDSYKSACAYIEALGLFVIFVFENTFYTGACASMESREHAPIWNLKKIRNILMNLIDI